MLDIHHKRQGQMEEDFVYYYTQSIHKMKPLLKDDHLKLEVIQTLKYLTDKGLIQLYAFVIMHNHIHLLWKMLKIGRESPAASFSKYTGRQFKIYLEGKGLLGQYQSEKKDRNFQFWKRDPLAIPISSEKIFFQRLDYIHYNPVKAGLCAIPEEYRWGSAVFYLGGKDEFEMLTRYPE